MTPEERAGNIALRYEDGLSRDALNDLRADIAQAIAEAVAAERERCVKIVVDAAYHGKVLADYIYNREVK